MCISVLMPGCGLTLAGSGTASGHCLARAGLLGIVKDREASLGIPTAVSYITVNYCCHQTVVTTGCWLFMASLLLAGHGIIIVGCSWHYHCWLVMALLLLAGHSIIIVGWSWHYYCWLFMALLLLAGHGIIIVGYSWHYYCWLVMVLLLLAGHGIIIVGCSWHCYYLDNGTRGVAFATLTTHPPSPYYIWSYGGINMMCMLFVLALMLILHRV